MNFIATHTDFTAPSFVNGDDWTILSIKELNNTYPCRTEVVKNKWTPVMDGMNELFQWRWIYEHHTSDWVSLHQYRRYINYGHRELTLPQPLRCNMHRQYGQCHRIDDLLQCESIIDRAFPQYHIDYDKIDLLYPCNMFSAQREVFDSWFVFVSTVLDIFSEQNNLTTDDSIVRFVRNTGRFPEKDIAYQSRLQGFLAERISTIWWLNQNFTKKPIEKPINIMSSKINVRNVN